jgi:hypothetical protein
MEKQIIIALQEPGVQPGVLLSRFFAGVSLDELRCVVFRVFRSVARDEGLLPVGMCLEELALLLDQLTDLAVAGSGRGEAAMAGEVHHV